MQQTDRLPKGEFMIGTREIAKALQGGLIEKIFVASNCPGFLQEKISTAEIVQFQGDQRELASRLGKPFPVAMAGLKKPSEA